MSLSTPTERLEPVLTWIEAHRDAAIANLQRFCRHPSISAQGQGMQEMAHLGARVGRWITCWDLARTPLP